MQMSENIQNLKKTLVLGASPEPSRYSHLAVNRLRQYGHPVIAVGKRRGNIGEIPISPGFPTDETEINDIHTVTLYLNPSHQESIKKQVLELKPKRVIFNPGTENPDFEAELKQAGIQVVEDCTLVMLGSGDY